jgi:hypothetical protein
VAPGLLDAYSSAAAAYSLRNLSWAYGGPVVRVRRSSDNAEQDFTATQVTDGTLTTFCGSGNGFVRTWYDQSGNGRNIGQATNAAQPALLTNGLLLVDLANKPKIDFTSTTNLTSGFPVSGVTVIEIVRFDTAAGNGFIGLSTRVASNQGFASDNQNNNYLMRAFGSTGTIALSVAGVAQSRNLYFTRLVDGAFQLWSNGSLGSSLSSTIGYVSQSNQGFCLGLPTGSTGGTNFRGSYTEIIIYPSDVSTNRIAIESNINAHYAIY